MTKIKTHLKRSEKLTLLNALRSRKISKEELLDAVSDEGSDGLFIYTDDGIYHLSGTNQFFMSESEVEEHIKHEGYKVVTMLPCKEYQGEKEPVWNGEEYIDWPEPE